MKNLKYVTLAALLLSCVVAGCGWNPFRKKPVAAEPPIVNVAAMDNTGAGTDTIRPDTAGAGASAGTDTAVAVAPVPVVPPAGGTTYTIKKKDTLWSIAAKYLGSGKRWPEIVSANPGLDPKKLGIGQTIKIPPK